MAGEKALDEKHNLTALFAAKKISLVVMDEVHTFATWYA
jgi:hypothetical protein